MWKAYASLKKYPKLTLREERRLIREAKKRRDKADELVLRHVTFIIFRIYKKSYPKYIERFGEDILSQAIFILYAKIKSYNLRYYDKQGNFKPVRFVSYIWKAVDGHILACLKKELEKEKRQKDFDWERFNHEDNLLVV